MRGNNEVFPFFQTERFEDLGLTDLGKVLHQYFVHRATGLDHTVGGKAFAQQVFARDAAVGEVDVAGMVDDFPVAFFGNPLVEATVTGFHVEDGDVALFGGYGAKAGVGVAQNQKGIGVFLLEDRVYVDQDLARGGGGIGSGGIEEMVGLAQTEVFEEEFVEFVIVILAGVDQDMVDRGAFI